MFSVIHNPGKGFFMHFDGQVIVDPSENRIKLYKVTVPYFVGLSLAFIVIGWALDGWAHDPLWYFI